MLQTTAERGLPQVVCKVMATAEVLQSLHIQRLATSQSPGLTQHET
jgi:hypothetical protein